MLPDGVERGLQEVDVAHAGDLHRVLERQEDSLAGPLLRRHGQQVGALVQHLAGGDLIAGAPREDMGQSALARAVGPHDGVHLARSHAEVEPAQDLGLSDRHVEVF